MNQRVSGWVPVGVLIVALILFFLSMFDGLRDSWHNIPVNFRDIMGLALGLFLICLYLSLKLNILEAKISEKE